MKPERFLLLITNSSKEFVLEKWFCLRKSFMILCVCSGASFWLSLRSTSTNGTSILFSISTNSCLKFSSVTFAKLVAIFSANSRNGRNILTCSSLLVMFVSKKWIPI